jgi:hypothetical protein
MIDQVIVVCSARKIAIAPKTARLRDFSYVVFAVIWRAGRAAEPI